MASQHATVALTTTHQPLTQFDLNDLIKPNCPHKEVFIAAGRSCARIWADQGRVYIQSEYKSGILQIDLSQNPEIRVGERLSNYIPGPSSGPIDAIEASPNRLDLTSLSSPPSGDLGTLRRQFLEYYQKDNATLEREHVVEIPAGIAPRQHLERDIQFIKADRERIRVKIGEIESELSTSPSAQVATITYGDKKLRLIVDPENPHIGIRYSPEFDAVIVGRPGMVAIREDRANSALQNLFVEHAYYALPPNEQKALGDRFLSSPQMVNELALLGKTSSFFRNFQLIPLSGGVNYYVPIGMPHPINTLLSRSPCVQESDTGVHDLRAIRIAAEGTSILAAPIIATFLSEFAVAVRDPRKIFERGASSADHYGIDIRNTGYPTFESLCGPVAKECSPVHADITASGFAQAFSEAFATLSLTDSIPRSDLVARQRGRLEGLSSELLRETQLQQGNWYLHEKHGYVRFDGYKEERPIFYSKGSQLTCSPSPDSLCASATEDNDSIHETAIFHKVLSELGVPPIYAALYFGMSELYHLTGTGRGAKPNSAQGAALNKIVRDLGYGEDAHQFAKDTLFALSNVRQPCDLAQLPLRAQNAIAVLRRINKVFGQDLIRSYVLRPFDGSSISLLQGFRTDAGARVPVFALCYIGRELFIHGSALLAHPEAETFDLLASTKPALDIAFGRYGGKSPSDHEAKANATHIKSNPEDRDYISGVVRKHLEGLKAHLQTVMGEEPIKDNVVVLSVPPSIKRKPSPTGELASVIAEELGVKYVGAVTKRGTIDGKKSGVQKDQGALLNRIENIGKAFELKASLVDNISGKVVIIVDDTSITGASMEAVRMVLYRLGAAKVIGVTVAGGTHSNIVGTSPA
jgi:hypothetical protein